MKTGSLVAVGVLALAVAGSAGAGDAKAGKEKSGACAGCHGANGEGSGQNPPLAGMPEKGFIQAMNDYKSGKRANAMMKNFAMPLGDADVANMASYYASLKKK